MHNLASQAWSGYDPVTPYLGIDPKGMKSLSQGAVSAALLIIAKTGRQPDCPSTGEWIKKIIQKIIQSLRKDGNLDIFYMSQT